jgi:hypothetical protein
VLGIRNRILPFSHEDVDRTEMLEKLNFNTKFLANIGMFKTEDTVPAGK